MIQSGLRAVVCIILFCAVFAANAAVRYSYTSLNYERTGLDRDWGGEFNTSMRISGYFMVDQPLSPGLAGAIIVPDEFSFSNGVGVISDSENPAQADFRISTDTSGIMTGGVVELLERFPEELALGDIRHRITVMYLYDHTEIEAVVGGSPGGWEISSIATASAPFQKFGEWSAVLLPQIDVMLDKESENTVDLKRDKSIKIAILGGQSFDALQIDPESILFGPTGAEASPVRARGSDYNKDGYADLVLTFKTGDTEIVCGDSEVLMTGMLYSGPILAIEGRDTIVVVCP